MKGEPEGFSLNSLLRVKKVESKPKPSSLKRSLRIWHLIPLGVGSTIGAGVYVLIGTAAREKTGPALPLAFLFAGFAAALAALCYAELASRCPSAGSAYHYAYATVGEGLAWLIGWALILEYTLSGSAVARAVAPNIQAMLTTDSPMFALFSRYSVPAIGLELDLWAGVAVALVTLLLCSGVKESATVQAVLTSINVAVLLLVIVVGLFLGVSAEWPGYQEKDGYFPYGIEGVLGGAAMVFFSYVGFDAVASTAEEVQQPQRNIPLGIAFSLALCTSLYVAVAAVLVGLLPYKEIQGDTPLLQIFSTPSLAWARTLASGGALAAMYTTLLGSLLPQPRILLAMARDGLLPSFFSAVNASSVPLNATLVTGLLAGSMAVLLDIDQLSAMVSVGTLLAFAVVSVALLVLRYVPGNSSEDQSSAPHSIFDGDGPKSNGVTQCTLEPLPIFQSSVFSTSHMATAAQSITPSSSESLPWFPPPEPEMDLPLSHHDLTFKTETNAKDVPWRTEMHEPLLIPTPEALPSSLCSDNQLWSEVATEKPLKVNPQSQQRTMNLQLISAIAFGAPLLCLAVSGWGKEGQSTLARWMNILLLLLGGGLCIVGSVAVFLLPQVKETEQTGISGGFRCPWVPALPLASIYVNTYLLVNLGPSAAIRSLIWMFLGAMVYIFYGSKNSKLTDV